MFLEHIPTACARVEALRSHGYRQQALRLAVAIVRTMKKQQQDWQQQWKAEQERLGGLKASTHYIESENNENL